ncbi:MAG TPA: serine/threonine-protein kinase, partial [Polyangiaceae bacterium]
MSNLSPGTIFAGEYRIIQPLSAGGMGTVYIAEQMGTGKRRALKLMLPELVRDERLRARFAQEARVGARIDSEHVVEVVDAGVDTFTGMPYLAMELLDGEDLSRWRPKQGALSGADARRILEELCHAVGAAHRVGIVHRDLKPENLFVTKSKRVGSHVTLKVLDFGIAKLVDEARSSRTAAVGTPLWMAPEQTESSTAVAPATDVWAIGLIAFWL